MKVILDSNEVTTIIERMAIDMFLHIKDIKNIAFIGIQSRGDKIAERLRIALHEKIVRDGMAYEIPLGVLNINFYRDDLKKNYDAPMVKTSQIDFDITGKHIILVDDVFYTGRTVRAALDAIFECGRPAKISLLTLVKRPGRELPVLPEFIGLEIRCKDEEYIKVKMREVEGEDLVCLYDR